MRAPSLALLVLAALVWTAFAHEPAARPEPVAQRIEAKIEETLVDHEFSDDDAVAVTVYIFELFLGPRDEARRFLSYVASSEDDSIEVDAFYDGLKVSGYRVKFFRGANRKAAFVRSITRVSGDG